MKFLEFQKYQDYEVIISDNYTNQSLSCKSYCDQSNIRNLKYIKPDRDLSVVENWNYASEHTTGDYVAFFTDKMLLLPNTLKIISDVINKQNYDILNWIYDRYNPDSFDDYFDSGLYISGQNFFYEGEEYLPGPYDPKEALQKKASCHKPRTKLNSSEYARGKICFGLYSRELINRIKSITGSLFHYYTPDYNSMILGLTYANNAYEISHSGIVQINTDISSGGTCAVDDSKTLKSILSMQDGKKMISNLPINELYSSINNCVLYEYTNLKKKFSLEYEVDIAKWLIHIREDLYHKDRVWSSHETEKKQKEILNQFISYNLNSEEKDRYERLCAINAINRLRFRKKKHEPVHCDTVYSILNNDSFN